MTSGPGVRGTKRNVPAVPELVGHAPPLNVKCAVTATPCSSPGRSTTSGLIGVVVGSQIARVYLAPLPRSVESVPVHAKPSGQRPGARPYALHCVTVMSVGGCGSV